MTGGNPFITTSSGSSSFHPSDRSLGHPLLRQKRDSLTTHHIIRQCNRVFPTSGTTSDPIFRILNALFVCTVSHHSSLPGHCYRPGRLPVFVSITCRISKRSKPLRSPQEPSEAFRPPTTCQSTQQALRSP